MAKRGGFLAELNRQAQRAEMRARQQQAAAYRASAAAQRDAERTRKEYERARAAAAKASAADKARAEKEAIRLRVEAQLAEVEALNGALASDLSDIDGLLASTLAVDDYVDLESLKRPPVVQPDFDPGDLAKPIVPPAMPELPPEPVYVEPPAPRALFGAEKKRAAAIAQAQQAHAAAHAHWREHIAAVHSWYADASAQAQQLEVTRLAKLAQARDVYEQECIARDAEAAAVNAELTQLINDLAFDVPSAIQEYVGIVLANSVYPAAFPVEHEFDFDLPTRELSLRVLVPEPSTIPAVKEYRYVKAKDEITTVALPVKEKKDRYASAIWQVALRSLHEVFEADRAGKIHSIALTVGVQTVSPATGKPELITLVGVAADRETFGSFDLSNVVPQATLQHLGAAMSKSPFDLTPADVSRSVRTRNA